MSASSNGSVLRRLLLPLAVLSLAALTVVLPAPSSSRAAARPPRKVAFLIGVEEYQHDFSNLKYTERDVTELARVLRATGFEVVVLTSSAKGKDRATRRNIEDRLQALLAGDGDADKAIGKGDLVLLAFSGHGQELELPDPKVAGQKLLDTFLAPADGKKGNPATLVSLNHLLDDMLIPSGARNLLLLDACREVYEPNKGKGINGQHVSLKGQTAILFSCAEGQESWPSQDKKIEYSVFTYAVLQALQEAADKNQTLSWTALVSEVEKRMTSEEFQKMIPEGKTQTPVHASGQLPSTLVLTAGMVVKGKAPALLKAPFTEKEARAAQAAWAKHLGRKVEEEIDLSVGVKLVLVLVPPGAFTMGSPKDEKDRNPFVEKFDAELAHAVTLTKPYYLGKYAVTQGQYEKMADKNPSYFAAGGGGKEKVKGMDTAGFPVEQVSWEDADVFCKAVGKKVAWGKVVLPTEAQREYGCRAGTETPFWFGSELNGKQDNCNGNRPYGTEAKGPNLERTCAVGGYGGNGFGLYDVHGNVWEWCQDWYGPYEGLGEKDPVRVDKGSEERRVLRGGSWSGSAGGCRAADRGGIAPADRYNFVGFRVCVRLD